MIKLVGFRPVVGVKSSSFNKTQLIVANLLQLGN